MKVLAVLMRIEKLEMCIRDSIHAAKEINLYKENS